jgi:hypothetical protein
MASLSIGAMSILAVAKTMRWRKFPYIDNPTLFIWKKIKISPAETIRSNQKMIHFLFYRRQRTQWLVFPVGRSTTNFKQLVASKNEHLISKHYDPFTNVFCCAKRKSMCAGANSNIGEDWFYSNSCTELKFQRTRFSISCASFFFVVLVFHVVVFQ